jgi:uncharacterized membrane protein
MREWLLSAGESVVLIINAIVLIVVVVGTIEAFLRGLRAILGRSASESRLRDIYLQYGRWLVAALTFEIGSDIIETSMAPTWQEVGRLGAISAIRIFLNFFLERDLAKLEDRVEPNESARYGESNGP